MKAQTAYNTVNSMLSQSNIVQQAFYIAGIIKAKSYQCDSNDPVFLR